MDLLMEYTENIESLQRDIRETKDPAKRECLQIQLDFVLTLFAYKMEWRNGR